MKHAITFIIGICISLASKANDTITVGNNTIKVPALGQYTQYYAFNEGDIVLFSMEERNGKDLAEFEIIEYPSSSISMEYKKIK
jgi:hypothetical protein